MTDAIELVALDVDGLPAFAALLGRPDFGGCFCAVWTAFRDGSDWQRRCADGARPNLEETRSRVERGEHVGFLVRRGGALVGWTGAGRKSSFPALATRLGARLTPATDDVWSIGCIALPAEQRGQGLAADVVRAVIALARSDGGRAVEAYPTRPWDEPRSYRGAESTYRRLGFVETGAESDGSSEILLLTSALA